MSASPAPLLDTPEHLLLSPASGSIPGPFHSSWPPRNWLTAAQTGGPLLPLLLFVSPTALQVLQGPVLWMLLLEHPVCHLVLQLLSQTVKWLGGGPARHECAAGSVQMFHHWHHWRWRCCSCGGYMMTTPAQHHMYGVIALDKTRCCCHDTTGLQVRGYTPACIRVAGSSVYACLMMTHINSSAA